MPDRTLPYTIYTAVLMVAVQRELCLREFPVIREADMHAYLETCAHVQEQVRAFQTKKRFSERFFHVLKEQVFS